MSTNGRRSGVVGYNVQVAVDAKHHLIVAHEVTNDGSDRAATGEDGQGGARRDRQAQAAWPIADRGYYSGRRSRTCHDAGIDAIVPKPMTSNAKAEGRFDKSDFIYIARDDEYQCPAGERAIYRFTAKNAACRSGAIGAARARSCPMKDKCTPSDYRRISRWEHEAVLTAASNVSTSARFDDECVGAPSNMSSERSSTGWVRPTS
jgi:hypothetical protein